MHALQEPFFPGEWRPVGEGLGVLVGLAPNARLPTAVERTTYNVSITLRDARSLLSVFHSCRAAVLWHTIFIPALPPAYTGSLRWIGGWA